MGAGYRALDRRQLVSDRRVRRRPGPWLAVAAVSIAAVIAYAPSFAVPFQFDDDARIGENQALQEGRLFDALAWFGNSRVVPSLTLVLNYRLGGFDPVGYHVVNAIVHLLASFGVMALALALCRTPRLRERWPEARAWTIATVAGLLFACHPLQTQAVTYVIQRYASMAALFYVWAVVCYLRGRIRQTGTESRGAVPYFTAGALLALAAVLSKENAVSLPAAWLLAEWIGFGWPRRWRMIAVGALAALIALAVPLLWKTVVSPSARLQASDVPFMTRLAYALAAPRAAPGQSLPTVREYLLTEATVLPRYLLLVVRPWGLNVDPDVPFAPALSPAVLGGVVFLAALAALGLSQVRRRPFAAFALLWFFVTLSVESSLIPIVDPMVEHRMYLPMAGVALGAGALFAAARDRMPGLARAGGVVILAALVALTFARNLVWQSPLTLWLDAVEKSPDKGRPHTNLGGAYHKADRLDEAVEQYCRALKLDPDDPVAHDNLELALTTLGKFDAIVPKVVAHQPDGSVVLEVEDAVAFCPHDRS
jgi:protein O-mannosyl-transferase